MPADVARQMADFVNDKLYVPNADGSCTLAETCNNLTKSQAADFAYRGAGHAAELAVRARVHAVSAPQCAKKVAVRAAAQAADGICDERMAILRAMHKQESMEKAANAAAADAQQSLQLAVAASKLAGTHEPGVSRTCSRHVQLDEVQISVLNWLLLVRDFVVALLFLDRLGVAHNDVKLANFLCVPVDKESQAKADWHMQQDDRGVHAVLCDFGNADMVDLTTGAAESNGMLATVGYQAPESVAFGLKGRQQDKWALGVCLAELWIGFIASADTQRLCDPQAAACLHHLHHAIAPFLATTLARCSCSAKLFLQRSWLL